MPEINLRSALVKLDLKVSSFEVDLEAYFDMRLAARRASRADRGRRARMIWIRAKTFGVQFLFHGGNLRDEARSFPVWRYIDCSALQAARLRDLHERMAILGDVL